MQNNSLAFLLDCTVFINISVHVLGNTSNFGGTLGTFGQSNFGQL